MTIAPFDGLAGLYAVGALNADDRRAFEEHIELCRGCVDEVMSLLPVAHVLTRAVPYHDPPPRLRARVIQAITGAPPAAPVDHLPLQRPSDPIDKPRQQGGGVGRALFNLAAVLCLVAAGGLGWYASQQVNLARALEENLDAANQRAILAELQVASAQQVARESSQRADILAAGDLVTMTLAGQPAAPDGERADPLERRPRCRADRDGPPSGSGGPDLPPLVRPGGKPRQRRSARA